VSAASKVPAFLTRHLDGDRRFLILCDHASNYIPPELNGLGLAPDELTRHIAYDPGALPVALRISEALGCPLVASQFSRLLIDPNRGLDDPTLVMKLSDGAIIPANAKVDPFQDKAQWQARVEQFYRPYDQAIAAAIAAAKADGIAPIIMAIHSFTPVWRGQPRPWHTAVLWDKDDRLKLVVDAYMAGFPDICYGDNTPYSGRLKNDCLYRHGTRQGLAHALIELRQDEVGDEAGQHKWATHMVAILQRAVRLEGLGVVAHYGSVHDAATSKD